jgi:membrane dipeptidase
MFVKAEEPTTIEHVLDHFDHVAKLVGVEHLWPRQRYGSRWL